LKRGCRLSAAGDVLLIPEGALRLEGPGRLILDACDGTRSVPQVIAKLLVDFPAADPDRVTEETSAFLNKLAEKGAIEFV
jgi:hypothetical protein